MAPEHVPQGTRPCGFSLRSCVCHRLCSPYSASYGRAGTAMLQSGSYAPVRKAAIRLLLCK